MRKTQFPRLVIPLSVVVTSLFNLALNLIVVVVFLLAFGVSPQWTWFLFPFVILALFVFATAVSMLLSSLYVRFRDTAIIWSVVSTALFYATPVLYPIERVPSQYRDLILLNPLTPLFEQTRKWVIDPARLGRSMRPAAGRTCCPRSPSSLASASWGPGTSTGRRRG